MKNQKQRYQANQNSQRVDLESVPASFAAWLEEIVEGIEYGSVQITIVNGVVERVVKETSFKPRIGIDKKEEEVVVLE